MTTDAKVQIGLSTDFLEGTSVTTPAGANLFREGVVLSDPDVPQGRANVRQLDAQLVSTDKAIVTNSVIHGLTTAGHGAYVDVKVSPSGALQTEVTGTVSIAGTVNIAEPVTVEATDLDIRNLSSAQDSVTVTGSVSVSNFPATQAVLATDLDIRDLTSVSDSVLAVPQKASTGGTTAVSATTTPFTILAANANRKGATFFNTSSTSMLYLALGPTVSSTLFTIQVAPTGYYELPFNYVGLVSGVFSTAIGGANVTELT